MFDSFSLRSTRIVFAARIKAGKRGAGTIDIDDLLVGLVLEDQGMLEKGLFGNLHEGTVHFVNQAPLHAPFFSPEIANDFLARIPPDIGTRGNFKGHTAIFRRRTCLQFGRRDSDPVSG